MTAVQGFVKVAGSSIVILYSIVSALTRVNRSTRCRVSDGRVQRLAHS